MTEILFYHLSKTSIEETLPGLVVRSLARDWRVVLQFDSLELLQALDKRLWTFSEHSFIPHGADLDEFAVHQPVFLTLDRQANPNDANIRFCLEGGSCSDFQIYQRLVVMFEDHDKIQLEKAREQWRQFKAQGVNITYWQQDENRGWRQKL